MKRLRGLWILFFGLALWGASARGYGHRQRLADESTPPEPTRWYVPIRPSSFEKGVAWVGFLGTISGAGLFIWDIAISGHKGSHERTSEID